MLRRVQRALPVAVVAVLITLAGCSHYLSGEREAWRHEAEVACLNSGAVKDGPERVQISAISGPGICGIDFPLRVSALGVSGPLGYDDDSPRPPGSIPQSALPSHWPVVRPSAASPSSAAPSPYGAAQTGRPETGATGELRWQVGPPPASQPGAPMSIYAPGVPVPEPDSDEFQPAPPRPYEGASGARMNGPAAADLPSSSPPPNYPPPIYPAPSHSP